MKNLLVWIYGIGIYLIAFISLSVFALFTLNLLLPITVDTGGVQLGFNAWLVNASLIALFGVQHSVMARPNFKHWLSNFIAEPLERSFYLLFSSAPLLLLVVFWQPMEGVIWQSSGGLGYWLSYALGVFGWLLVVLSTFSINHFDLFGLRQIYFYINKKPYTPVEFKQPILYRIVRHPMQLGVLLGIWFIPTMTVSHLVLAIGMTFYILIGLYFEERDLVHSFGEHYKRYQRSTPKLIPNIFFRKKNRQRNSVGDPS